MSTDHLDAPVRSDQLQVQIEERIHPKLLYSATQTLGLVAWMLVSHMDHDASLSRVRNQIETLRSIHSAILRHSTFLKTRIQACRSLILLTYRPRSDAKAAEESLYVVYESTLVALASLKAMAFSSTSSSTTTISMETMRRRLLPRLILLLVFILSERLIPVVDLCPQAVLAAIAYHLVDIVDFLQIFLRDREDGSSEKIQLQDLSLTSPPLMSALPKEWMLHDIHGGEILSYQELANDICHRLLKLGQQSAPAEHQRLMNDFIQQSSYRWIEEHIRSLKPSDAIKALPLESVDDDEI
jgi:hypothetical protein